MKTLEDFTPEIQAKIPEYIARGTEGVFDGGRYNDFKLENAIRAVNWNYKQCGYKEPLVLVAENPLEAQYLFNFVKFLLNNNSQLDSQLDSQLGSQLGSQLRSQLGSQLDSQLYLQLRSQLRSQLDSQLYLQLYLQLYSQLDSQLNGYNYDYLFTLNVYSDAYSNWFEFMYRELNIPLTDRVSKMFHECFKLQKESGVYSAIFSDALCVVSKYPKKISRNDNNDLHSLNGNSVEWGYKSVPFTCHYINGRYIPENYFSLINKDELTVEQFLKEENEEYKSSMIAMMQEKYGDEKIVSFFSEHLKEVDTYIDNKEEKYLEGTTKGMNVGVYTLFKGEINGEQIAYVRCYCPSTDRMFFLGVEPNHTNAKDAIASLMPIPKKLKLHTDIQSINRQGEKYSLSLTMEGLKKSRKLTEEDFQDTYTLDGDTYFKNMNYEY